MNSKVLGFGNTITKKKIKQTMEIKFANHNQYSFEEVMKAKDNGGSFVTYQWIIPLPLIYPIKRLSKVYFIPSGQKKSAHALSFNIVSSIIGWWGFPWGPTAVYRAISINRSGGVDVTADVYLNLTEEGYAQGKFKLEKSAIHFAEPANSELKELRKVFQGFIDRYELKKMPIVGLYLQDKANSKSPTIIGFHEDISNRKEEISKAIYKRFFKHYQFELIHLENPPNDYIELENQGVQL